MRMCVCVSDFACGYVCMRIKKKFTLKNKYRGPHVHGSYQLVAQKLRVRASTSCCWGVPLVLSATLQLFFGIVLCDTRKHTYMERDLPKIPMYTTRELQKRPGVEKHFSAVLRYCMMC